MLTCQVFFSSVRPRDLMLCFMRLIKDEFGASVERLWYGLNQFVGQSDQSSDQRGKAFTARVQAPNDATGTRWQRLHPALRLLPSSSRRRLSGASLRTSLISGCVHSDGQPGVPQTLEQVNLGS